MRTIKFISILLLSLLLFSSAYAQDGEQTRSLTSDDFVAKRPVSKSAAKTPAPKAIYKLSGSRTGIRRSKTAKAPRASAGKKTSSDIGVTVWKLVRNEISATVTFPVKIGGRVEQWAAERVSADTAFRAGDRVRLAVETSVSGYLYVVDSEMLDGDSYGDPYLIFPAGKEGNRVIPGMLVDIPDQKEDLPYFNINPKASGYNGELLTVIVSPVPIAFKTDRDGRITDIGNLSELELGADFSIFDRNDDDDKIYSKSEADAACGTKTRMLVRENAVRPCGEKTRQLTRDEPAPQSVYRVRYQAGKPAVAFVKLNVRQ